MINANELRTGNIFWETYGGYKVVTAIGCNKVGLAPNTVLGRALNHTVDGCFDLKDIYGVTLTPEILEKCGLVDCENISGMHTYLKWTDDKLHLVCDFIAVSDIEIKYLHQLQNLYFALTQTELTYHP